LANTCLYKSSIILQNITKLTETVDELSVRDCRGYFVVVVVVEELKCSADYVHTNISCTSLCQLKQKNTTRSTPETAKIRQGSPQPFELSCKQKT